MLSPNTGKCSEHTHFSRNEWLKVTKLTNYSLSSIQVFWAIDHILRSILFIDNFYLFEFLIDVIKYNNIIEYNLMLLNTIIWLEKFDWFKNRRPMEKLKMFSSDFSTFYSMRMPKLKNQSQKIRSIAWNVWMEISLKMSKIFLLSV